MTLKGKIAVVTGAAKGIGKSIAIALAEDGADLVITENVTSASDTAKKIEAVGRSALVVKADVSNPEDANRVIESCIEKFGKIDILVNNAGINKDSLILRMKKEDWDSVIGINLTGTFNCTKAATIYIIKPKTTKIIKRWALSLANVMEIALPIPFAAPVTTAALPCRFIKVFNHRFHRFLQIKIFIFFICVHLWLIL